MQTPIATIGVLGANYIGGIDFVAGQFGYAASFNKQPVQLPKDPGVSKFDADSDDAFLVGGQGGCIMN